MAFTLFKKGEITGKKQIIDLNKLQAKTLHEHCEKLILNLNQYDKSEKIDKNMQIQIQNFLELWTKLYSVTKLVVNKYCVNEKQKKDGTNILTYMSQNMIFNNQNPIVLITELKKREDLLKKIISELDLLQDEDLK